MEHDINMLRSSLAVSRPWIGSDHCGVRKLSENADNPGRLHHLYFLLTRAPHLSQRHPEVLLTATCTGAIFAVTPCVLPALQRRPTGPRPQSASCTPRERRSNWTARRMARPPPQSAGPKTGSPCPVGAQARQPGSLAPQRSLPLCPC